MLSQVIVIISNELNISYAQAIRLERKLVSAGYCIAKQTWVERAAAMMDDLQAVKNERKRNQSNAGRGQIASQPARGSDRQLSPTVRVRRDGDGAQSAEPASSADLCVGADGAAS